MPGTETTGKMGATPIRLHLERCLNIRHHHAGCTYCVESCPKHALSIEGREVIHDVSACIGCGTCLVTCPMEVFTTRGWSERRMGENLAELTAEKVQIVCARHPEAETEQPRDNAMRLSVCLSALSPGMLFERGLTKAIDLRVDACEGCELACVTSQIENSAALANSWLASLGHEGRISLSSTPAETIEEKRSKKKRWFLRTHRADDSGMNRRDFLAGFARDGSSLFAAFLGLDPDEIGLARSDEPSHVKKRPHLHRWREDLSKAWPTDAEAAGATTWPRVTIGDACTGCRVCEQYCPSGALSSHLKGGRLVRTFTPGVCADCALCALACPSTAITRGYEMDATPFERKVVLDERAEKCSRCKTPVIHSSEQLCHWCAAEPRMDDLLDDAKRHLLGLMRS